MWSSLADKTLGWAGGVDLMWIRVVEVSVPQEPPPHMGVADGCHGQGKAGVNDHLGEQMAFHIIMDVDMYRKHVDSHK